MDVPVVRCFPVKQDPTKWCVAFDDEVVHIPIELWDSLASDEGIRINLAKDVVYIKRVDGTMWLQHLGFRSILPETVLLGTTTSIACMHQDSSSVPLAIPDDAPWMWFVLNQPMFRMRVLGRDPITGKMLVSGDSAAKDIWQLPSDLLLPNLAANYYLLVNMAIQDRGVALLEKFVALYAPILQRYVDMVVGGEIRYARSHLNSARVSKVAAPLWEQITLAPFGASREDFWLTWHKLRHGSGPEQGASMLVGAMSMFVNFRRKKSYGGYSWANIARILARYEAGAMSSLAFIDFVWGLQHNNGSFFNKLQDWNKSNLQTVLNANLDNRILTLYTYASPEMQALYLED